MRSPLAAVPIALLVACGGGGGADDQGDPCGVVGGACPAGEQCCEADVYGLPLDQCAPRGQACPLGCPDGEAACELGAYCQPEPATGDYTCAADCDGGRLCDFNVCCPAGGSCADGACALPDLEIGTNRLEESVGVELRRFEANACELSEGCVGAPGERLLLRFDLVTINRGEGDLFLGSPVENPLFHFSDCHGHHHFSGFATFRLIDGAGVEVASTSKFGFCLLDGGRAEGDAPQNPRFNCDFQGLQAGWRDVYGSSLPCQWLDVTGIVPGDYTLEVELNPDRILAESDYGDNVATVDVTIPPNSCPGGCRPPEPACCAAGDPCGRAGDGVCDCGGVYGWDAEDCGACQGAEPWCDPSTTCPDGCQEDGAGCVVTTGDGVCDLCDPGADAEDCGGCLHEDPVCPAYSSCPNGCTPDDPDDVCCSFDDIDACDLAGNGSCDCGGADWDALDCGYCTADDPDCP